MTHANQGNALMLAGIIVILVGLGIVLIRAWGLPGYWIPLLVGVALLVGGVLRRGGMG